MPNANYTEEFIQISKDLEAVCQIENEEFEQSLHGDKISFEVLQFSEVAKIPAIIHQLVLFYNNNYYGDEKDKHPSNADFIHIPDLHQMIQNCKRFPVVVVRDRETGEFLGLSTLKFNENQAENVDPYHPKKNGKSIEMTGIIARKNSQYKGLGSRIYEIEILGALKYIEQHPDVDLFCVIDCRNVPSFEALKKAVSHLREIGKIDEKTSANLIAYYEVKTVTKESKPQTGFMNELKSQVKTENVSETLVEAATFVVGVQQRQEKQKDCLSPMTFSYQDAGFAAISDVIRKQLEPCEIKEPVIHLDEEAGLVYYHELAKPCDIENIVLEPHDTARGNDRKRYDNQKVTSFHGPMPDIYVPKDDEMNR